MNKIEMGNKPMLYPYPVTILGANENGKPNFMALSFVGIVNINPGMVAMGIARNHVTPKGIKENMTFSINLPNKDMIEATDYVGIVSGEKVDKSGIFKVEYGKLKTAPMISSCPLSMECKVTDILDRGGVDDIIIAELVAVYCDESCLTNGNPDIEKLDPIVLSMFENRYFSIGDYLGKAWNIGKNYKENN